MTPRNKNNQVIASKLSQAGVNDDGIKKIFEISAKIKKSMDVSDQQVNLLLELQFWRERHLPISVSMKRLSLGEIGFDFDGKGIYLAITDNEIVFN